MLSSVAWDSALNVYLISGRLKGACDTLQDQTVGRVVRPEESVTQQNSHPLPPDAIAQYRIRGFVRIGLHVPMQKSSSLCLIAWPDPIPSI